MNWCREAYNPGVTRDTRQCWQQKNRAGLRCNWNWMHNGEGCNESGNTRCVNVWQPFGLLWDKRLLRSRISSARIGISKTPWKGRLAAATRPETTYHAWCQASAHSGWIFCIEARSNFLIAVTDIILLIWSCPALQGISNRYSMSRTREPYRISPKCFSYQHSDILHCSLSELVSSIASPPECDQGKAA